MDKRVEVLWTTRREIEYLERIGTNFGESHIPKFTKREMLKKYIDAMRIRVNWGALSKKDILFAATEMLESC